MAKSVAEVVSRQAHVPPELNNGDRYFWSSGTMMITPGFCTLEGIDSKLRIHERLGRQTPRVIEGYGEWELVDRPRRRSLTIWAGRSPLRIQSSIMFDSFKNGKSVEARIREFERMAGLEMDKNGVEIQPPLLVRYDNGPHDNNKASQNRWVIEKDVQWDLEEYNGAGERIRAEATFVFLEYVDAQVYRQTGVKKNKAKQKAKKDTKSKTKKKAKKSSHTVKRGETLAIIAAREVGDREAWQEIAKLNAIRDPNNIRVGMEIDLP